MTVKYLTIIQIETIAQTISDKVYNPTIEHLHTEFSNKITEAVQTFVGENIWTSFLSHPEFFNKTSYLYFRNFYDLIHPIFPKISSISQCFIKFEKPIIELENFSSDVFESFIKNEQNQKLVVSFLQASLEKQEMKNKITCLLSKTLKYIPRLQKEFPEAYEVYKTIVSTPISTTSECDEVENIRAKLISNESKKI